MHKDSNDNWDDDFISLTDEPDDIVIEPHKVIKLGSDSAELDTEQLGAVYVGPPKVITLGVGEIDEPDNTEVPIITDEKDMRGSGIKLVDNSIEDIDDDPTDDIDKEIVAGRIDPEHPNAIYYQDLDEEQKHEMTISLPHTNVEGTLVITAQYMSDEKDMSKYNALEPEEKLAVNVSLTSFNDNGVKDMLMDNINSKEWDSVPDMPLVYDVGFNDNPKNKYAGGKAELAMSTSLGLNPWSVIVLPHTGIRLTIDTIPESDISSLDITIRDQLSEVGKDSNGLSYSNATAIYDEILIDFILSRVKTCTLKVDNMLDLKDHISILDKPILIGVVLKNMFPRTFPYMTSCGNMTQDPNDETRKKICGNVYRLDISVASLYKVDKKRITPYMDSILKRRLPNTVSVEELVKYNTELSKETYEIDMGTDDNLKIHLRIPNLSESIASGLDWVDKLSMLINETIHITEHKERQRQLEKLLDANRLTDYTNMITNMESDNSMIDTPDGIFSMVQLMMGNPEISVKLATGIEKHLRESVIAIMGVKSFKCTKCNHLDKGVNDSFRDIIHISDMSVFLNLRRLKEVSLQEM